jgi:hypothetical protein
MIFFDPANAQKNIRVSRLCEWLDWAAGNRPDEWQVSLPMIQRGFVWKPSQIIQLWDTLFQGLPFGALLVSELPEDAQSIDLVSHKQTATNQVYGRLGLVDGQQRTLAMLAGWPLPSQTPISHRIWVDFADAPRKGELLSLRITTRNQPFGYSRDKPNVKLPLADRRKALTAWENQVNATQLERSLHPNFLNTRPWSNKKSLTLDLSELIQWWQACGCQSAVWQQKVLSNLKSLTPSQTAGATELSPTWEALESKHQQLVIDRVCILATGLERIDEAQIPLLRVDERLFDTSAPDSTEPPLALLFNRIGSNSTRLSDNDYVYAILKHLRPEVHQMVTALHDHDSGDGHGSVASLMSSTDLALTALRLACATDPEIKTDPENPDKEDFHKLIKTDGFLDRSFLPVLTSGVMRQHFDQVLGFLDYREGADPGLPRHALPHLSRPLVQVLLRLSQVGYLADSDSIQNESRRCDALRFVLQWWLCAKDNRKASKKAYLVVAQAIQEGHFGDTLGYRMMDALLRDGLALAMPSPSLLQARPGLTDSRASHANDIVGVNRFNPLSEDEADKQLCDFWQHWCTPSSHRYPLLLWLQRSYVATMDGDPVAGRDEDTPYDYDHILPHLHWGDWTGYAKGTRILEFMKKPYVIGNCIGNIRAWGSSDNRSDGALAPAKKLLLIPEDDLEDLQSMEERQIKSLSLLESSGIEPEQAKFWISCLPVKGTGDRCWSFQRTKNFEIAVEQRAFSLYRRFYQEPDFQSWALQAESVDISMMPEVIS